MICVSKLLFTVCFPLLFNLITVQTFIAKDSFSEELLVKPLTSGHVYSYFQFTTLWNKSFESRTLFSHCHLFPRSLGEVIGRYDVQELHISLSEGLWRHEYWGYPVVDAPPGAELWIWFKEGTQDINTKWKEITGALSGLLCASLNFIDSTNSLSPNLSFRLMGIDDLEKPLNASHLRYATLPREIVCTENLTPWKKLLPCDSKRGLATLLNAGYIHNTNYHSLGIHLRPICMNKDCSATGVELRQTVSLVYDLVILGGATQDWSIRKLFGMGLTGACPLAQLSSIYVDISSNQTGPAFRLQPQPTSIVDSIRGGHKVSLAVYNITSLDPYSMINIAATYDKARVYIPNIPPVLYANRYIVGYGQERGGIVTKIHNRYWKPLTVIYLENIPWFVPIYYHTLKIVSEGKELRPLVKRYVPGRERVRPYFLEVAVELPARSVTEIAIEFDYMFLKWQEYPPDANHGFYVGSAVITALVPIARNFTALPQQATLIANSLNVTSQDGYLLQVRTEALIITLPTPDFSMPYNVICLACTVVALAFGPLHNITTKRLQLVQSSEEKGTIAFVKAKIQLLFNKKTAESEVASKDNDMCANLMPSERST